MVTKKEKGLLIEVIERLAKIEKDIEYISKHVEVMNSETDVLCKRIKTLEDKGLEVKVAWKVLGKIGGSIVTVITVASIILKIMGVI